MFQWFNGIMIQWFNDSIIDMGMHLRSIASGKLTVCELENHFFNRNVNGITVRLVMNGI